MNPEQQKWLEDYCNGVIEPEEFTKFEEALLADETYRAKTRKYLAMDSHLRQGEEDVQLLLEAWATPRTRPWLSKLPWLAFAAAIALFAGYVLKDKITTSPAPEIATEEEPLHAIAMLSHTADAVWGNEKQLTTGDILFPGELVLKSGLAEIEIFSGTRILLEGETKLDLVSLMEVVCEHGTIRAHVPPHARGFQVNCEQFQLVDLGTEFGMQVNKGGPAEVHVFDGEVEVLGAAELERPESTKVVTTGDGLTWVGEGSSLVTQTSQPEGYPSFDTVQEQRKEAMDSRMARWQDWSDEVNADPRLLIRYNFQEETSMLMDSGPLQLHGTIVGTEPARGRWSGKHAREFKRPGDRIRIDVPGAHDTLTLMTWMRIDALPSHNQGLLLPDDFAVGRPHWVITMEGNMYFGLRNPDGPDGKEIKKGYNVHGLFNRNTIAQWMCYTFVYDRTTMSAAHYVDGVEVVREELIVDQPLTIGASAIGNWGLPPDLFEGADELQNLVGRIDDFVIWSAALTPEEISASYNASRP